MEETTKINKKSGKEASKPHAVHQLKSIAEVISSSNTLAGVFS